jgi:hypothetical protein
VEIWRCAIYLLRSDRQPASTKNCTPRVTGCKEKKSNLAFSAQHFYEVSLIDAAAPSKRSSSSFQGSGLDVQIVQVRNGPLAVSAMAANEAQFYTTLATGSSLGSDGVLK